MPSNHLTQELLNVQAAYNHTSSYPPLWLLEQHVWQLVRLAQLAEALHDSAMFSVQHKALYKASAWMPCAANGSPLSLGIGEEHTRVGHRCPSLLTLSRHWTRGVAPLQVLDGC